MNQVCKICGGAIFRHTSVGYPHEPRGPWLHVYLEDWEKDPHDAEPISADAPS